MVQHLRDPYRERRRDVHIIGGFREDAMALFQNISKAITDFMTSLNQELWLTSQLYV